MKEKLFEVLKKLESYAGAQLVAVSKKQSTQKILDLYNLGQKNFGENYVQEADLKIAELKNYQLTWHFIGHLQKNKVKNIVGKYKYIHSVDSLALAQVINQKCLASDCQQKILLEINIGQEDSKTGFTVDEFKKSVEQLSKLTALQISGLMVLPPPGQSANVFARASKLFSEFKSGAFAQNLEWQHLSMGTSSDYELALDSGATMIRLGEVLFGPRN
jgi:pyridoxal phosphate enzyme (YggS family)